MDKTLEIVKVVEGAASQFTPMAIGFYYLILSAISLAVLTDIDFQKLVPNNSKSVAYILIFVAFLMVSYVLGEFFLFVGDTLINRRFRNKDFDWDKAVEEAKNNRNFCIENLTPNSKYCLTLKNFLGVKQGYHLSKSEFYYNLSIKLSGIWTALISWVFTTVIFELLSIFGSIFGKSLITFVIAIFISLSYPIIILLVVLKVKAKGRYKLIFYLFLFIINLICLLPIFIIKLPHLKSFNQATILAIQMFQLLLIIVSFYMAEERRKAANFFFLMACRNHTNNINSTMFKNP